MTLCERKIRPGWEERCTCVDEIGELEEHSLLMLRADGDLYLLVKETPSLELEEVVLDLGLNIFGAGLPYESFVVGEAGCSLLIEVLEGGVLDLGSKALENEGRHNLVSAKELISFDNVFVDFVVEMAKVKAAVNAEGSLMKNEGLRRRGRVPWNRGFAGR